MLYIKTMSKHKIPEDSSPFVEWKPVSGDEICTVDNASDGIYPSSPMTLSGPLATQVLMG